MIADKFEELLRTDVDCKTAKRAYMRESNKIIEKFKEALFEEYSVKDNNKKEECFNIAWDYEFEKGLEKVESMFKKLVELIK